MKFIAFAVFFSNFYGNSFEIYLTNNSSKIQKVERNPAIWTENDGVWGPILEDWIISNDNHREARVTQLIPIQTVFDTNETIIENRDEKEGKISGGGGGGFKIVNNGGISKKPPSPSLPTRQITETDMYLLGAIEKLVYRADFMEKRLRRVEEMLYFVMAGSKIDQEPCPENFNRAGMNCYLFAGTAGRELDWKAASKQCKKYGAVLAEMETIEENQDVIAYIQTQDHLKGRDYWTGGLNPGLLWIWSNSARPIKAANTQGGNQQEPADPSNIIPGNGRCLRLAYNPTLRSYAYRGTDCGVRYSYVCELAENSASNELRRLGRSRKILNDNNNL